MSIEAFHQSHLNMILRCGEQFRRRYLENEIIPPGIAAGRGIGLHKANETNLKQKIISKKDLPIADLQDVARDGYVNAFKNGVFLPRTKLSEKDKLLANGLDEAVRLTRLYHDDVAPGIEVAEVEKSFSVNMPGIPLPIAGKMDIETSAKIDDLKTTTRKWPDIRIKEEIQPVMYSYAHKEITGNLPIFTYHILIAHKSSEERQIQTFKATDDHFRALYHKLGMACKSITSGVFVPANPSSWWCSENWCGYYLTCPYVGNSLPKKWI